MLTIDYVENLCCYYCCCSGMVVVAEITKEVAISTVVEVV